MNALTIEELKALPVGEWVYIVYNGLDSREQNEYIRKSKISDDTKLWSSCEYGDESYLKYSEYGTTWIAYKNKEQAEATEERFTREDSTYYEKALVRLQELENKIAKGEIVELPCNIGDTVFLIYSIEQSKPISFVVNEMSLQMASGECRLYVFDSNGYGGQFGDCCRDDFTWFIGTDKSEAERRLAELKGEKI